MSPVLRTLGLWVTCLLRGSPLAGERQEAGTGLALRDILDVQGVCMWGGCPGFSPPYLGPRVFCARQY